MCVVARESQKRSSLAIGMEKRDEEFVNLLCMMMMCFFVDVCGLLCVWREIVMCERFFLLYCGFCSVWGACENAPIFLCGLPIETECARRAGRPHSVSACGCDHTRFPHAPRDIA